MRKGIFAAVICLCGVLMGCHGESSFQGERLKQEDCFQLNYLILNRQEDNTLRLQENDRLVVEVEQEAGTVDIRVEMEGSEPIYEGNGLEKIDFTLNISESGSYQITVVGHHARGSVKFQRVEKSPEEKEETDLRKVYEAFQFALQQIAFEHIYPDGTDTGFDGASGFIEDNHFAIFDLNGDGAEELIVQFITAPMAGNVETVYAYNKEEDGVDKILTVFPAVTYYQNGLVKEEWSHGSGLAGEDYWPYNLYRYQPDTNTYDLIAEVNMWSKSVDTVDYKGDLYPEDVDAENAGTVFILTRNGVTETVSKGDYEAWLSEIMGNAQPVQIPYQSLSEENIKAVCDA